METDSLSDIALIEGVLRADGIDYFIQGGNPKFLQPMGPARLMVAKEDLEKATDAPEANETELCMGHLSYQTAISSGSTSTNIENAPLR